VERGGGARAAAGGAARAGVDAVLTY